MGHSPLCIIGERQTENNNDEDNFSFTGVYVPYPAYCNGRGIYRLGSLVCQLFEGVEMLGIQTIDWNVKRWVVTTTEDHLRAVSPYLVGEERLMVERELQKRGDRLLNVIRNGQTP